MLKAKIESKCDKCYDVRCIGGGKGPFSGKRFCCLCFDKSGTLCFEC